VDLVGFARAFNAAWNDHDVEGVVAFFAPDATVRQTRAVVALGDAGASTAPVIEDVYGAGPRPFADAPGGEAWPQGEVLWAAGPASLRAWLPRLFASGHRVGASDYRTEGGTVSWRYLAFADPYQHLVGVEPAQGTAHLQVRSGRVAALVFEADAETVARRTRQLDAAQDARTAAAFAALRLPAAPGPLRPADQVADSATPGETDPRLLLALVGAAGRRRPLRPRRGR
jgi:hypothetical protein